MKVRIVSWAAAIACVTVLLQGCSGYDYLEYLTPEETETREYMPDIMPNGKSVEEPTEEELEEVSDVYYGYQRLSNERQIVYLEMLEALTEMKDDVKLSTMDESEIDLVFNCLMYDHPELFYVEGYKYVTHLYGDVATQITFSGSYSMDADRVSSTKAVLDSKINECLMNAPDDWSSGGDEYYIVKYFYEWVIDNTEYVEGSENNQNICSVFLNGQSVCQGYAKAVQYLLQKSGIECFIVAGFAGGNRHAWNLAKINGKYYYLDPTWGDASYSYNGDTAAMYEYAPDINYDYFLVTTDELTRTHSIEHVVELPECDSINDNYFVREGLYFTQYDEEKLEKVFESYASRQAGYVTIKCSEDAYEDIISELIDSYKIFDFVDDKGSKVAYTFNKELKTITFWNIY
jgi:hypothetical protein